MSRSRMMLRLEPEQPNAFVDAVGDALAGIVSDLPPAPLDDTMAVAEVAHAVMSAPGLTSATSTTDVVAGATPAGTFWLVDDPRIVAFVDRAGTGLAIADRAEPFLRILGGVELGRDAMVEAACLDQVLSARAIAGIVAPLACFASGPERAMVACDTYEREAMPDRGSWCVGSYPSERAAAIYEAVAADAGFEGGPPSREGVAP